MEKPVDIKKIRKAMEKSQEEKRFTHTLGVAYTAAALAMCYDVDVKKAEMAGMLHDCAKAMTDEKRISICEKHNISMTEIEKRNPFLLHAKVGSFIAMNTYRINDTDIINAILNHTLGRPGMSQLEKIVFVADYIEPSRKQAPNLKELRKLSFHNLDQALLLIIEDTLRYLESIGSEIEPITLSTYEYYKNINKEMENI